LGTHLTIRVDQTVEVDLAVGFPTRKIAISRCPVGSILLGTVELIGLVPHIEIAAGHQLPVVELGMVAVVVV
jgi:hypothetical protein